MSNQKQSKLNFLLNTVPPGFLVDGRFLRAHGFKSKSVGDYLLRGWLERVGWGVYRRPMPAQVTEAVPTVISAGASGDSSLVPGTVAVASMQRIMGYDFHVGGFSALALLGHLHHLPLGRGAHGPTLHLYGDVPSWAGRVPLDVQPLVHTRALFAGDSTLGIVDGDRNQLVDSPDLSVWHYSLRVSTSERAILEAIDELPNRTTFDAVSQVFEGLTTLRPTLLSQLLQACRSVKVKRLFMVFADHHRHAWREHLDVSRVNLGAGSRALVKGGKLHPVYQIAVAEPYLPIYQSSAGDCAETGQPLRDDG